MACALAGRVCSVAEALSAGAWHDTFAAVGRRSSDPDACTPSKALLWHRDDLPHRYVELRLVEEQPRHWCDPQCSISEFSMQLEWVGTCAAGASQEPAMVGSTCEPEMVTEQDACPSTSAAGSSEPCGIHNPPSSAWKTGGGHWWGTWSPT
jgi:hypothetical protein